MTGMIRRLWAAIVRPGAVVNDRHKKRMQQAGPHHPAHPRRLDPRDASGRFVSIMQKAGIGFSGNYTDESIEAIDRYVSTRSQAEWAKSRLFIEGLCAYLCIAGLKAGHNIRADGSRLINLDNNTTADIADVIGGIIAGNNTTTILQFYRGFIDRKMTMTENSNQAPANGAAD